MNSNKESIISTDEFDINKVLPIPSPSDDGRVRIAVEFRLGNSGELNLRLERIELLRKDLAKELRDLSEYVADHPFGISLNEE